MNSDNQLPGYVQEKGKDMGLESTEGWQQLIKEYSKIDNVIGDLDSNLNTALRKQEYQYLQAYNIYVKKKEKELKGLIEKLDKNNEGNNVKEKRITTLEKAIDSLRSEASTQEEKITALKTDIKILQEKYKLEIEEKEFFHKQALDAKRKNKLLKVAITRIQRSEPEEQKPMLMSGQDNEKDGPDKTFLTGANIDAKEEDLDNLQNSQAIVEANLLKDATYARKFGNASMQSTKRSQHKRTQSQGGGYPTVSRYRNIPTENVRFSEFINLLLDSEMEKEDMKFEIVNYHQSIETQYTRALADLKLRSERLKNQLRKEKAKGVNDVIEKGDLETLFVDCVEDVRRNVIKRRLKAEIIGRKKIGKFDEESQEAREFEESLLKLANLAKDRVKYSEFTSQDRNNLLDLFVNNERTLLRIYEILFPRRAGQGGA